MGGDITRLVNLIVKNIFKLFAVCDKKVSIFVTQADLKNDKKWVAGWKQIVSS